MKQITKQEINKLDKHLQGLKNNWLSEEIKHTSLDNEFFQIMAKTMQTSKLPNSNYKDLRVLRDIINKLKED
ncbi:hypothetical protein [uncultured Mediterranean phage uvDeep-CGR2-KM21-C368]|nr:hypothetical protein [uncultured Mediterranean phage uvDeep-CGR2-KM21-C368]